MRRRRSTLLMNKARWPGKRKRHRFPRQAKCRICRKKIDMGNLCYYCRKRRTS